jgi:DNA-binding NtrC family response regulator
MGSAESQSNPHVLFLNQNSTLVRLVTEVLALEGISCAVVTTVAQTFLALSSHVGSSIVLIDNLQVHAEGQQFLEQLRHEPTLRPHLRTICMAVIRNCEWAGEVYGDVLDAFLPMPFTVHQLLAVL